MGFPGYEAASLEPKEHCSNRVGIRRSSPTQFLLSDSILLGKKSENDELVGNDAGSGENSIRLPMH